MSDISRSNSEKRRIVHDIRRHEEEVIGSLCSLSSYPGSPKSEMEQERRIRREIANSNERRRMQSINAGFQSLRALLPHHEGEKLSKAAILQQTTQYIYQMEQEKTSLLSQNCQLKRRINQQNQDSDGGSSSDSPLPKRKRSDAESPDDLASVCNGSSDEVLAAEEKYKKELIELRIQLEKERRLRMMLEEQTKNLEVQLYPDRVREIANQVHLQYQEPSQTENFNNEVHHDRETSSPLSTTSLSPRHCEHSSPITITTTATIVAPIQHDRLSSINRSKAEVVEDEVDGEDYSTEENDEDVRKKGHRGYQTPYKTVSPARSPPHKTQITVTIPSIEYPHSTSRQNLETIVEAIRHLEGDHLFNDEPTPKRCEVKKEPSPPLTFTATSDLAYHSTMQVTQTHQTRPGVIVSAHS